MNFSEKTGSKKEIGNVLDEVIKSIKFSAAFEYKGDLLIYLSEDPAKLKTVMRSLVEEFFEGEEREAEINGDKLEKTCEQIIEKIPEIIEEMKRETEERMTEHFNSCWYGLSFSGKREVILTEPSVDRLRRGAKDEIMLSAMYGVLSKNPVNVNKYGFSEENLHFLKPKLSALVDQLLEDYKNQISTENTGK